MREHQAAIGGPRRPPLITRHRRHRHRRSAGDAVLDRHDEDVEAFAAIGGEREAAAVGRPRRLALNHDSRS